MYIKRNEQHEIVAVSLIAAQDFEEYLDDSAAELQQFLQHIQPLRQKDLAESDLDMVRVLEDLVGLLIERNIIRFTDLPPAAQNKLLSRRELRNQHQDMNLLDNEDNFPL